MAAMRSSAAYAARYFDDKNRILPLSGKKLDCAIVVLTSGGRYVSFIALIVL